MLCCNSAQLKPRVKYFVQNLKSQAGKHCDYVDQNVTEIENMEPENLNMEHWYTCKSN